MDGLQINQKIRYGYYKAAKKLGAPHSLYRSATPFTPVDVSNLIGSLPMVASQDWTWMKANRPGNSIWFACVDARDITYPLSVVEGDYLVGDKTWFVLSIEYQLPAQVVECNKFIDIIRPEQFDGAGYNGNYIGYQEITSTLIMEAMPISMLLNKSGSKAESKLPTDTIEPSWICLLPNLGNVEVRTGDIIIGRTDTAPSGITPTDGRFVVSGTEETEFGWRITCIQVMN